MFSSGMNTLIIQGSASTSTPTLEQQLQQQQQFAQLLASAAASAAAGGSANGGGGLYGQPFRGGDGLSGTIPQQGAYPYPYPYPYPHPYPPGDFSARETGTSLKTDLLTVMFGYCMVGFCNVLFQGLLNMHALLDNPFGKERDGDQGGRAEFTAFKH